MHITSKTRNLLQIARILGQSEMNYKSQHLAVLEGKCSKSLHALI